ncbi:DUF4870 domain-containing protein [Pseudoxanthomonas indica]|uniref:DUF4870 domain-containing protein n=1 Tax=Pseudoxanthomonas indica TaxID=428993 RepID=A0A1T5J8B8_9GAMM|nr:DUF4870 domain-containing protein [Pseudoxanthomonas indica]GGD57114.1 membrane protein [Pseudoxanthomonas indica]SKC47690.1 hypothetical protein SAMN06296058_0607 [Pseudoxanthomonas indica]
MSEFENATTPPPPPTTGGSTQEDRTMALVAHLLGILTSFIGPLVIWLINKDKNPNSFVVDQSKEALNFQITLVIVYIIGIILSVILIGALINLLAWLACIIFSIVGAVKANSGEAYRYPFALRLIK